MKSFFGLMCILTLTACVNATEQTVYLGNMGGYTYNDTDVYGDGVAKEGLRTTGQIRVEETATDDNHVPRFADMVSSITSTINLTVLAVADIDDPSTELNAVAGSSFGKTKLVYEDGNPTLFTLYAWDPATDQVESVPHTVDASTGIWVAVAGRYQILNDLIVDDAAIFNNTKGATGDLIVHGDNTDNVLHVDVSANDVLFGNGEISVDVNNNYLNIGNTQVSDIGGDLRIENAGSGQDIEVYTSGWGQLDLANTITNFGSSTGTLQMRGPSTFNSVKTAGADFKVHGDTVDDIIFADVSADAVYMRGATLDIGASVDAYHTKIIPKTTCADATTTTLETIVMPDVSTLSIKVNLLGINSETDSFREEVAATYKRNDADTGFTQLGSTTALITHDPVAVADLVLQISGNNLLIRVSVTAGADLDVNGTLTYQIVTD